MKKPSVPKCFGGSQKIFLGCSTSSLAVFYVEQVALNRHVSSKKSISIPYAGVKEFPYPGGALRSDVPSGLR